MENETTELEWVVIEGVAIKDVESAVAARMGDEDIVLFRVNQQLVAVQRWCPHQRADLAAGTRINDMIKCPWHGFIFRLSDGKGMNCRGFNLESFDVRGDGDQLKARRKPLPTTK